MKVNWFYLAIGAVVGLYVVPGLKGEELKDKPKDKK